MLNFSFIGKDTSSLVVYVNIKIRFAGDGQVSKKSDGDHLYEDPPYHPKQEQFIPIYSDH